MNTFVFSARPKGEDTAHRPLAEHYPDGTPASTWFALMPWACGSILEGLTGDAWDW